MLSRFNNLNLNTKNIIVLISLVSTIMLFNIVTSIISTQDKFEQKTRDKANAILEASITSSKNILKDQENPDATKLLKREFVKAFEKANDKQDAVLNSELYKTSPFVASEILGNNAANDKAIKVKYQQESPKFESDALNDFAKQSIEKSKNSGELFNFFMDKNKNLAHGFYAIKVSENMLKEFGDIKNDIDGDGYDSFGFKMPAWRLDDIKSGFYISLDLSEEISALNKEIFVNTLIQIIIALGLIVLFARILKTSTAHSIQKIKNGLDSFFMFLNKEVQTCPSIEVTTDDDLGKMATSINKNISKIQKGIKEDNTLMEEAKEVIEKVKVGDYEDIINASTSNESLENFKNNVNDMISTTKGHFSNLNQILENYTNYNYTEQLTLEGVKAGGVFCTLANDINNLRDAITNMLLENKRNGLTLQNSSDVLLKNVNILNTNSTTAAASLEETAAALEELTGNVSSNNTNIQEMANISLKVTSSANEGEKLAVDTTKAMDDINTEVSSISDAISVIDQIAFQTNILSLNAAVEAATAGEAGKGFAVVAAEVRNLASRSAEAAKEIKDLVEKATHKANSGKNIADEMINGYKGLNENITKTIALIKNVEIASKEQQTGISQINDAVNSLDKQTQENANIAQETNTIAIQTDCIAKIVVKDADEKEFVGKDEVKVKSAEQIAESM
ncbi:MAG: methyl-accepting chemotaxis protein [Sphaerochaetaceae bacterium]|nr:methyl-accepting chemotaxis protein [Sphaerochaetaceae bacterium]